MFLAPFSARLQRPAVHPFPPVKTARITQPSDTIVNQYCLRAGIACCTCLNDSELMVSGRYSWSNMRRSEQAFLEYQFRRDLVGENLRPADDTIAADYRPFTRPVRPLTAAPRLMDTDVVFSIA